MAKCVFVAEVVANDDPADCEMYPWRVVCGVDSHGTFRIRAVAEAHARDITRHYAAGCPRDPHERFDTVDAGPMDATR